MIIIIRRQSYKKASENQNESQFFLLFCTDWGQDQPKQENSPIVKKNKIMAAKPKKCRGEKFFFVLL